MKSPDLNLLVVRKFQGQLWNEWEESIAISPPSPSPSPALFRFKVRYHNIWRIALGSQWNLLSVDAGILQSWSKLNQLVLSYRGKKAFLSSLPLYQQYLTSQRTHAVLPSFPHTKLSRCQLLRLEFNWWRERSGKEKCTIS